MKYYRYQQFLSRAPRGTFLAMSVWNIEGIRPSGVGGNHGHTICNICHNAKSHRQIKTNKNQKFKVQYYGQFLPDHNHVLWIWLSPLHLCRCQIWVLHARWILRNGVGTNFEQNGAQLIGPLPESNGTNNHCHYLNQPDIWPHIEYCYKIVSDILDWFQRREYFWRKVDGRTNMESVYDKLSWRKATV